MTNIAELLMADTCKSMSVFKSNLGYEVILPSMYPSGEHLSVIINEGRNNEVTLHDGGFALMSVASMGFSLKPKYVDLISRHARSMGCEFKNGRVFRVCSKDNIAPAAMTISNVCMFITSLAMPASEKNEDFADAVREALSSRVTKATISPKFKATGQSGGIYEVTAALIIGDSDAPKVIFEAIATPKSVNSKFRHLYDIGENPDYSGVDRVAVYDDKQSFSGSDLLLLQGHSNVVAFPDLSRRLNEYAA